MRHRLGPVLFIALVASMAAAAVEQRAVPLLVQAIGSVEAYSVVSVRAQVGGELVRVHIKEGQDVKKGDLLFTIDPRVDEAALAQAQATLPAIAATSSRPRRPSSATGPRPRTPRRRNTATAICSARS